MFTPVSSLHLRAFAIFVVFVRLPSSDGVDDSYKMCSSVLFSCGKLKDVGFPFWGDGRPQYCGHPALQLQCIDYPSGRFPYLKIGPKYLEGYNVLNITFAGNNITLELRGAPENTCGSYGRDFGGILEFTRKVEIINLLYKCNNGMVPNRSDGNVTCYEKSSKFPVYYRNNNSAQGKYASCNSAPTPVLRKEFDLYNKGNNTNVSQILYKGFEVNYAYPLECVKCYKSGCICGTSSPSKFVCLCKQGKWKLALAIVIPVGLFILAALSISLWYYKKLKFGSPMLLSRAISFDPATPDFETGNSFHGVAVFSYTELQEATNNFDDTRELGDGGFGIVYYGKLKDGREVAVKRLYEKNYKQVGQFMNEIEILTRLRHPNLVTLYGCTSRHSRELLLVYDYISNGTVADHLHGKRSESGGLTWEIRMKIAIETASALSYLHTSEIVHRDVKTTNILLDSNFSVKVADFGLSRLFPLDMTHVSTTPQGTPGYLDPTYHKCYQVTNKSDVYSFGVVLVELISSLPAVDIRRKEDEINLSDYAMKRIQRGLINELVDKKLGYNADFKVKRAISLAAELAFQCLQQEKEVRPSMAEVLEALTRIEELDYEALEAVEKNGKKISVIKDDGIRQLPPSPSSVIDNWAMKSIASDPSS
ncbi:LEAF RUST 10 DISEASE-RESISTANCE LOCUS RECEPTOR-LIKE PROTEIN KINASE-like 1.2 [Silene latifolia]|uniref:LEAF RUST 10 DISEASE-RESISTANCE LOCUS RECEPTOR-LIKE PROTEIN KINASE-like 1.2 n=1 Tax=Silene latifolia TaxID=37657 RepID=UPI003D7820FE